MTHGATVGNDQPGLIWYGENLQTQRITINGGPSGGILTFGYLDGRTDSPVSVNATAAQVRTALRTLPFIDDVRVTGPAGGPWLVKDGPGASLVEMIRVHGEFTGGSSPVAVVEVVTRAPLQWPLVTPDSLSESSVPPQVPRTAAPSENADHATQTRAQEVITFRNQKGGLGRKYLKEADELGRIWDGECLTHLDDQIILPPAVQSVTIDAALTANPTALSACEVGVTSQGDRCIAAWDVYGNNVTTEIVYLDVDAATWKKLPKASGVWTANTPRLPITFYQGYAYIGFAESGHAGYLTWNGGTATDAVQYDTTDNNVVVDFTEWDGKLFRLQANGKIQYTVAAPAATENGVGSSDWSPVVATYRGIGYAYGLEVYGLQDGKSAVHVLATDGIYFLVFDNAQSVMSLQKLHSINGSIIPRNGRLPQANSFSLADGNMWITTGEENVNRWDGNALRPVGPDNDDGLPTRSIGITSKVRIRGLLGLQNYLIAFCSGQAQAAGPYTTTAELTVTTPTTYADDLYADHDVNADADISIDETVDDQSLVLLYNKQGWHPLVPIRQPGFSTGMGSRAGCYHELFGDPRLEFAPGKYVTFHDSPSNPREWEGMKFDTTTTRYVVGSWQDGGVPDVDKVGFRDEIGYQGAGDGRTITPYFQTDDVEDTSTLVTSSDSSAAWKQHVDKDGVALVIGDNLDLAKGRHVAYFDRDTGSDGFGNFSRGIVYRQLRHLIGLASDNPDTTPVLLYVSTPQAAKFNALDNFPSLAVDLTRETDGRAAHRMVTDGKQLYRSKLTHPFSGRSGQVAMVSTEFYQVQGMAPGAVMTDGAAQPFLELFLGEWTRFL